MHNGNFTALNDRRIHDKLDFITYWKNTDFSEYNEMDVREEFISQLLHLLG